jgi:nucleotide-binding universal stress UspA family protein
VAHITHILLPYDFSAACSHAASHVQRLARHLDAHVTVYSVVPPPHELALGGLGPRVGDDPVAWQRDLQRHLDAEPLDVLSGLSINRVTNAGAPADRIVEFADAHAVDLIMMPTHGLGFFRNLIIGSVTLGVLRHARQPVWTEARTDQHATPHSPLSVICAVDGTDDSLALARWAADFSNSISASLLILHVIDDLAKSNTPSDEIASTATACKEIHRKLEWKCRANNIDAPVRVLAGDIVRTIAEQTRELGGDLVIVGRGRMLLPFGRLRTHAFGIIHGSPCPVLSV